MAAPRRPKKLSGDALWEYALRALASRSHSTAELRRKLVRRAESVADVGATVTKLLEYKLLDDRKYSANFASSRLANEGFGRFRVLRDLHAKQVPQAVAQRAVAEIFEETDEQALAEGFLLRKYRGKDLPAFLGEPKNLASAYRRLRTAGFTSSVSFSTLKKFSLPDGNWEEFEETDE